MFTDVSSLIYANYHLAGSLSGIGIRVLPHLDSSADPHQLFTEEYCLQTIDRIFDQLDRGVHPDVVGISILNDMLTSDLDCDVWFQNQPVGYNSRYPF